jgi:hypothetical protein
MPQLFLTSRFCINVRQAKASIKSIGLQNEANRRLGLDAVRPTWLMADRFPSATSIPNC